MLTQSPAAGIGPGQTTAKPFSPRDVKAHIMSAGALPRFGGAQATPESPAGDALIKTTADEESPQKAVINATRKLNRFMVRLRRFIHAIQKAFKQLFDKETPNPAKQLAKKEAKPHVQYLVQFATQDKRMDETLKRLSKTPGGEILQAPEVREQIREQLPALFLQEVNHKLSDDQTRDVVVAELLTNAAKGGPNEKESTLKIEEFEDPGSQVGLEATAPPGKQTEASKGQKAETPSSPGESEEPASAEEGSLSGLFSLLKNNMGG